MRDRQRLVDLLLAHRAATDVRLYPTIWRVLLLLTSRVSMPEKDTRLWENAGGGLAGFAMLWRRRPTSPYLVLDWFVHPELNSKELLAEMLAWGDQRAQEIATESQTPLSLYTSGFPFPLYAQSPAAKGPQADMIISLGFLPLSQDPAEHNIYFSRLLQKSLPGPALPPGYTIRRLRGEADLAAYQSIYSFAQVNPEHQQELLSSDEYCCLVVVNPAAEFAAYCECSIWRQEWELANQYIGWIDYIETREGEQGKGLGRAALLAGLTQLQAWGAETAMLVTINTNIPAVRLYEKAGFARVAVEEPKTYEKQVGP